MYTILFQDAKSGTIACDEHFDIIGTQVIRNLRTCLYHLLHNVTVPKAIIPEHKSKTLLHQPPSKPSSSDSSTL